MNWEPLTGLDSPLNRTVLDRLANVSAHSDVADALVAAARRLGDVHRHCPDPAAYRWVAVSTRGVIFAVAFGMSGIALRLDETMRNRALATGADSLPDWGDGWVTFTLFRSDWPKVDLEFWVRQACVAARDLAA